MKEPIFMSKNLWVIIALIPVILIVFTMFDTACFSSTSDLLVVIGYILFVTKWYISLYIGYKVYQIIQKKRRRSK